MNIFKIGDQVWWARTENTEIRITCPECLGKRFITVILGDDTRHTIPCICCESGWEGSRGWLVGWRHEVNVTTTVVIGVRMTAEETEYQLPESYLTKDLYATKDEAEERAMELVKERDADELRRMHCKEKDTRSWAWNVHYHRKCIRDAEKQIEYHRAKLDVAKLRAKE